MKTIHIITIITPFALALLWILYCGIMARRQPYQPPKPAPPDQPSKTVAECPELTTSTDDGTWQDER